MRRGHPGVSGWRGENQRPFRPRGGGTPNFRPSRPFLPIDGPRFPPPGPPRQYIGPISYGPRLGRPDNVLPPGYHERNKYRINNTLSQDRGYHNRGRQFPPYHQSRQNDNDYGESKFYKNTNQCHVNTLGDIDHRHQHQMSPWASTPVENNRQYYDDHRSPHKTPRHYSIGDDLPDYSGHRPPASDHYSSTTGPNSNNSQYTHSVDDTVDIVRKRLENRHKQQGSDSSLDHHSNMDVDLRQTPKDCYQELPQELPQEQPAKKRIHRQKNNKANCDTIKNKIVRQLFKMDKVKIHKLMDNPSSSTKFEYAISSLITEGQNSLNRHLRSVAEKSLCSSSTDFIQDDANTIYEDTFMKQMQGVLDPQDTILLEDIKPLVMAELSRVLRLDDYKLDVKQEVPDHEKQDHGVPDYDIHDYGIPGMKNEPQHYEYYEEEQDTEPYPQEIPYEEQQPAATNYNNIEITPTDIDDRNYEYEQQISYDPKPLFERRPTKNDHDKERRNAAERRQSRQSVDNTFGYIQDAPVIESARDSAPSIPLFDPNVDQLLDDDDPFAELDKQYHVAVDHSFIKNDNASRPSSPSQSYLSSTYKSPSYSQHNRNIVIPTDIISSDNIKQQIDSQLLDIAKSPVKLFTHAYNTNEKDSETKADNGVKPVASMKKENLAVECVEIDLTKHETHEGAGIKKEIMKEPDKVEKDPDTKSKVLQSNARKRSTDQKPSHRKEKHKRSSQFECQEAGKSILSMFYSHDNSSKETSKVSKTADSIKKTYSDKYVKRKEQHKKPKDKYSEAPKIDESKKHNNSVSSHSNVSPKRTNSIEALHKLDAKKKLKPIDMFVEQPKKGNTRQPPTAPIVVAKSPEDSIPKPVITTVTSFARKLSRKHTATQTGAEKLRTKACQTNILKNDSKHTQTTPVSISVITKDEATNPLERMKEIDMEIQLLLQEKFKLYNSLESKSEAPLDTIPSLSMRVFKVNTEEADDNLNDTEDSIVDDFTNIPTEELEQIALESIAIEKSTGKSNKKGPRQKVCRQTRKNSKRPMTKRQQRTLTSPNISLIEQILIDDRPIEDIISLDALEMTPAKAKKKYSRLPKNKISKKSKPSKPMVANKAKSKLPECSVFLKRIDISNYLKPDSPHNASNMSFELPIDSPSTDSRSKSEDCSHFIESMYETEEIGNEAQETLTMVQVVEEVVNDLQFDMLDVSEDIVIEDNCEVKGDDKANEKEVVSEEVILDNSQSSMEDTHPEEAEIENQCKMYDYSTNEILRRDAITVMENGDAVLAIESVDKNFIAACLDGNVYHFTEDGQLLNTLRGTNQAVTCMTIVQEKYGTTVYTGSLDSRIRYYDLETGMEKGPECNVLSPIQSMDRAWDTVFVGTRTGFVLQFECKNNMLIPVTTVKFSEQSILALRAIKEGPRKVLLVAARAENEIKIKDAQSGLLLRTLQGPKMSVYTLLFEDGKVYCGTSSHSIHVFDYTSGNHVGTHEGGKGAVCLRASAGLLFAGCYDGCVYVYREGEVRPLAQLRGPSLMLLSLAIQGTKIIAGYKDRGLYIWKLPLALVQEMIL